MNSAMKALQGLRQMEAAPAEGMAAGSEELSMPMGEDKSSGEYFLDRSLFGEHAAKVGDEVLVRGKITTIGNKVGFAPSGIEPAPAEVMEGEFDGGLHDVIE